MRRGVGLFLAISAILGLCNCAGQVVFPIKVAIRDKFSSASVGGPPIQLIVTVKHDPGDKGVDWLLENSNGIGCAPVCGTLTITSVPSFSATYTPPDIVPMGPDAMPTILAVSAANNTSVDRFTFRLGTAAPIMVGIQGVFQTVDVGGAPMPLTATVKNDQILNAGVMWSLTINGLNCSPACGVLTPSPSPSFAAVYAPPISPLSGMGLMPTITATSVTDPSKNTGFSFEIQQSALATFSYAFTVRGFDPNGSPMSMAGSLFGDAQGHITSGELDLNDTGQTTHATGLLGSYSTSTSFDGILRGTITITNFTLPGTRVNLGFKMALSADGTRGRIIEFDDSEFTNSGILQLQDPAALAAANPTGTYAFELDSDAPLGSRTVEVGQFSVGASGISGGLADQGQAGAAAPIYSAAPIAAGPATAPDPSGRGTLTLTVNGNSTQYAYYLVKSGLLYLIETDAGSKFGTVQTGTACGQAPLTAASVNMTSVLQMTGIDTPAGAQKFTSDVIIGVMTVSQGNTFSATFDSNDAGTILAAQPAAGTITSFDPVTGRGTIFVTGGFNSGFVNSAVFYLRGAGEGFLIETDPTANDGPINKGLSGTFSAQSGMPFSDQSLSGRLLIGSGASSTPAIPNFAGAANFDSGAGTFAAIGDLTDLFKSDGNVTDGSFNASYQVTDTASGRGTAMVSAELFGNFTKGLQFPASLYIVGPNQFVMIGTQAGTNSGVIFFDPQ